MVPLLHNKDKSYYQTYNPEKNNNILEKGLIEKNPGLQNIVYGLYTLENSKIKKDFDPDYYVNYIEGKTFDLKNVNIKGPFEIEEEPVVENPVEENPKANSTHSS